MTSPGVNREPGSDARLVGWRAIAAWAAAGTAIVLIVIVVILPRRLDAPWIVGLLFGAVIASYAFVGALVGTRRPSNPIGWLLLVTAVILGASLAASNYAAASILTASGTWPGTVLLAWFSAWTFLPVLAVVLIVVPLLYPTGRLLSPRWRWVVALAVLTALMRLVYDAFVVDTIYADTAVLNPFHIPALAGATALQELSNLLMLAVCFPLAVLATVTRFRRGTSTERAQLKWFISAAAFTPIALIVSLVAPSPIADAGWFLGIMGFGLVPASIAVALLRYRLYEIDRIISRTIAWAIVSGLLLAGFAIAIVALQGLLTGFTQGQTLAVAASTLLAFAAFQPLLRRVQRAVDHRFNRARYDAQRTADAFAERLRGEVAMDAVATDLQATIESAVRPAAQGLWLREPVR